MRDNFDVRYLDPRDPLGETIVWSEGAVRPRGGGDVIGQRTIHTYLDVFLLLAGTIIEDEKVTDVMAELQNRGLVPK